MDKPMKAGHEFLIALAIGIITAVCIWGLVAVGAAIGEKDGEARASEIVGICYKMNQSSTADLVKCFREVEGIE